VGLALGLVGLGLGLLGLLAQPVQVPLAGGGGGEPVVGGGKGRGEFGFFV